MKLKKMGGGGLTLKLWRARALVYNEDMSIRRAPPHIRSLTSSREIGPPYSGLREASSWWSYHPRGGNSTIFCKITHFFYKIQGPRKIHNRLKPIIIVSLKTRHTIRITVEMRQIQLTTLDLNFETSVNEWKTDQTNFHFLFGKPL